VHARHADDVRHEQHVELAALQRLGELDPTLDIRAGIDIGVGMAPSGDVVVGVRHQEDGELHFSAAHVHCSSSAGCRRF
jgi:hypothetical protein